MSSKQESPEAEPEHKAEEAAEVKLEDTPVDSKPTEPTEPAEPEKESPAIEETKTLATNTAGESILEETIEKQQSGDQVQKVEEAKDEVTE